MTYNPASDCLLLSSKCVSEFCYFLSAGDNGVVNSCMFVLEMTIKYFGLHAKLFCCDSRVLFFNLTHCHPVSTRLLSFYANRSFDVVSKFTYFGADLF